MASAGRILIMTKGNYDSSVSYEMLDMVSHNGSSWIAKKTVVGIEPSVANDEHWQQMSDFSLLNEQKQDKEKTVITLKGGERYKHTFARNECCLLCAFFESFGYSSIFACCGVNEWVYDIQKLSESIYNAALGSRIGI